MDTVYRAGLTDSRRWAEVALRTGDIVISAPSKCGNTWLQMICALLIFQTPSLPAPLTTLSPWVDMRARPLPELLAVLAAQQHRRFLKTHTPLDGIPAVAGVTYLVIGRDPLDVAVSMDHHRANLDSARIQSLLGRSPSPAAGPATRRERVLAWLNDDRPATETLDSLRALVTHLDAAWQRRADPAIVLLHYADLLADLPGQMLSLATRLGLPAPSAELVSAATFAAMRSRAAALAPDERLGLFTDNQAFFRSGGSHQWDDVLTPADVRSYERRLHSLASPALAAWLTRRRPPDSR